MYIVVHYQFALTARKKRITGRNLKMLTSINLLSLLALASTALAAPHANVEPRAPKVFLAGDSTMAVDGGSIAGT